MNSEGNGQLGQYEVYMSEKTKKELKQLHLQEGEKGLGPEFVAAFREILNRLKSDPFNVGEPLYRLPSLKLLVCQAAISRLLVDFAVHEEKPLVFIRGFKLLS